MYIINPALNLWYASQLWEFCCSEISHITNTILLFCYLWCHITVCVCFLVVPHSWHIVKWLSLHIPLSYQQTVNDSIPLRGPTSSAQQSSFHCTWGVGQMLVEAVHHGMVTTGWWQKHKQFIRVECQFHSKTETPSGPIVWSVTKYSKALVTPSCDVVRWATS